MQRNQGSKQQPQSADEGKNQPFWNRAVSNSRQPGCCAGRSSEGWSSPWRGLPCRTQELLGGDHPCTSGGLSRYCSMATPSCKLQAPPPKRFSLCRTDSLRLGRDWFSDDAAYRSIKPSSILSMQRRAGTKIVFPVLGIQWKIEMFIVSQKFSRQTNMYLRFIYPLIRIWLP